MTTMLVYEQDNLMIDISIQDVDRTQMPLVTFTATIMINGKLKRISDVDYIHKMETWSWSSHSIECLGEFYERWSDILNHILKVLSQIWYDCDANEVENECMKYCDKRLDMKSRQNLIEIQN